MTNRPLRTRLLAAGAAILAAGPLAAPLAAEEAALLTDPFLQLPTDDSVRVVWFTEFEGTGHTVILEDGREVAAETMKMSRLAEDHRSHVHGQAGDGSVYEGYTPRDVWRHEAVVDGLTTGTRVGYSVRSETSGGDSVESGSYSLAPLPGEGQPLRILMTSDHQLKPMTPANLQKVVETVGQVDAVFFAGDLQNIPDRASEWFDDSRGFAFFPGLQGRAAHDLTRERSEGDVTTATTTTWRGGPIIQNAPLFPVIGNHEVMGRFNPANGLGGMFNDPRPRHVAEALYEANAELYNPSGDPAIREQWIKDQSFNTDTYEEIFTLPDAGPAGERYYAMRFGDVFLIGVHGSRIWRTPSMGPDARGKYREADSALNEPDQWGWGEFIFEDMAEGSTQHDWLQEVLASEAFRSAPVRIALMHDPSHGLGDNSNPVFAHPVQILDRDEEGRLTGVRYEYPIDQDIFVNHVEPLLAEAGVDLVHTGHSHVWYRLMSPQGMHIMETSNVGNNYGCYVEGHAERGNGPDDDRFDAENYVLSGDPHGYEPVMPTEFAPMSDADGDPLPCIASNELTAFTILETGAEGASVSSYVFDTTDPEGEVRLFDRFALD